MVHTVACYLTRAVSSPTSDPGKEVLGLCMRVVCVSCPTLFNETTGPIFVKTKGLSTDMV